MGISNHIKKLDPQKAGLHVITTEEREKLKCSLICMLKDITQVLDDNHIDWSLSGGSILGAVRHKGFIPWDDDIDIFMTRKNFEKFKCIFTAKLGQKYRLRLPGEKGYIFHFPTIEKIGTKVKQIQSTQETQGVFIDVFILENAPNNKLMRMLHGLCSTVFLAIDSFLRVDACKENLLKYGASDPALIKAVKLRCRLSRLFCFLPIEKWLKLSDQCFSVVANETSEYVVCPSGGAHYFGEIFRREYMEKTISVDFENMRANIPQNADYYLSKRYGVDYMIMPKESDREKHAYIQFEI